MRYITRITLITTEPQSSYIQSILASSGEEAEQIARSSWNCNAYRTVDVEVVLLDENNENQVLFTE